jgi:hypothetical protein
VRQHLIALVACLATPAFADRTLDPMHPKPIDIKPMIDKLLVFRDETGMYVVIPDGGPLDEATVSVFYGDAKTMYQQRVVGFGVHDNRFEWNLWSPRVRHMTTASVWVQDSKMKIECLADHRGKDLVQLPADQAKAVLQKATFMPPLWTHQAHTLARDEDGVYYYVDQLRAEYGGNGYRVFIGQKGAMKEQAMTNVVSDSAGEIFATKSGELKIVTNDDGKAYWKKGTKKLDLIKLEPVANRYLIYRELGIYGALGVVCDDQ